MRPWILLVALAGCAAPVPRADELEAAFRQDPRWRGADAAYSVPLSSNRILWLFGDTWITAPDAQGREGARMIRNSLAIQSGDRVEFYWRPGPSDAFPTTEGKWLWPLSGLRRGDRLYLFFAQFYQAKQNDMFGFALSDNLLLVVRHPDDPPAQWTFETYRIPHFDAKEEIVFGAASVVEGDTTYVYGTRKGGRVILARTDALTDFARWEFRSASGWSSNAQPQVLFDGAAFEMSVSPHPGGFVAVYSASGMSPEIHARLAPRPEGPWSAARTVYRVPDVDWSSRYFSYAAKAHPELASAPDELVITYVTNSFEFADHFKDLRIYWPRFVRLTFRKSRRRGPSATEGFRRASPDTAARR